MERKSITVDDDAFEDLEAQKHEGETWTEFARRVADLLEASADDTESPDDDVSTTEHTPDGVLTEDHLDDIGAIVERRVENALDRQTRR